MSDPATCLGRVAILWRGDEAARRSVAPESSRFKAIFTALADVGVAGIPVVYEDDVVDTVRAQLATLDGVLVWVNPIHEGRNRANLDALLRDVASHGTWVSAHPDVIAKMGTKEVLYRTRTMSWGCDTAIYRTAEEMRVGIAGAARHRSARDQAQPWQRWPGRLEGRVAGKYTQPADGACPGCDPRRIGGTCAGRLCRAGVPHISRMAASSIRLFRRD